MLHEVNIYQSTWRYIPEDSTPDYDIMINVIAVPGSNLFHV
jgi:hypothetical protein